jgi:hypothetical protein
LSWGEGSVPENVHDRVEHRLCLGKYIVVPETQNPDATRFQKSSAGSIDGFIVLRSIQFDRELCFVTIEVENVRRNRMLPSEFPAVQTVGSEVEPEFLLGGG